MTGPEHAFVHKPGATHGSGQAWHISHLAGPCSDTAVGCTATSSPSMRKPGLSKAARVKPMGAMLASLPLAPSPTAALVASGETPFLELVRDRVETLLA